MMKTTLLTTFLALASSPSSQVDAKALLRGERSLENYGNNNHHDNHNDYGCIESAGYSWCASLNECLRPFETTCPPSHDAHGCPAGSAFCAYTRLCQYPGTCYAGHPVIIPGGDVDQYGCRASAGLSWCAASQTCEMYGYCLSPVVNNPGSDRDQYGCIRSAGYTWCDSLQECIRTFDTVCPVNNRGGDRDQYGCIGSAGYSWCDSLQECIRTFDTVCPVNNHGGDRDQYGCIGSAGYTWCDSLNECIRTFDTVCPPLTPPGGDVVDQYGCRASAGYSYCPSSQTCERYYDCRDNQPDGDVDEYGCRPSAGYSWCASRNQCIRSWETECFAVPIDGGDVDQYGCRASAGYSYCAYTRQCERPGDCCPEVFEPVCCDGNDYSNQCFAEDSDYQYTSYSCTAGVCRRSHNPGHHGGITGTGGGAVNGGGGSCR